MVHLLLPALSLDSTGLSIRINNYLRRNHCLLPKNLLPNHGARCNYTKLQHVETQSDKLLCLTENETELKNTRASRNRTRAKNWTKKNTTCAYTVILCARLLCTREGEKAHQEKSRIRNLCARTI